MEIEQKHITKRGSRMTAPTAQTIILLSNFASALFFKYHLHHKLVKVVLVH
jgi:hypothetical protein